MLGYIEAIDYIGNEEDVQAVSDLVDKFQDALTDYQVSPNPKQPLFSTLADVTCVGSKTKSHL